MRTARSGAFALAFLVLLVSGGRPVQGADLDWERLGDETADVLAELIRIDTQNPPGAETAAARAIARKLEAEGIPAEVVESAPGRGNLHARIRGAGDARPIILLSHLDVVPPTPAGGACPRSPANGATGSCTAAVRSTRKGSPPCSS